MGFDVYHGDCLDVLPTLVENSVDSVITDPPYGLEFMGKDWDHGVPGVRFWEAAAHVAKPGAMLLAFGGTRTHHRLMCAIEDAGWQLRDVIMWTYGSGFPKSYDISKGIDKSKGAEREVIGYKKQGTRSMFDGGKPRPATLPATLWDGWGTALKPAWEPIIVAMNPLDGTYVENAMTHGVAGLNIDECRVPTDDECQRINGGSKGNGGVYGDSDTYDYERHPQGRWPANLIHDGSDEVVGLFPMTKASTQRVGERSGKQAGVLGEFSGQCNATMGFNDNGGSAARFFYCAKASRSERECDGEVDNPHPTVKPLDLMRYLARLTKTPTGGVVLDPFMGSGTTGMAAVMERRDFVGIEQEAEYLAIARQRIEWAARQPQQLVLLTD